MGLSPTPKSSSTQPPTELRIVEIDVPLKPGAAPTTIALPADSPEEAFNLLYQIGDGTNGGLAHATVLQVLRDQYKSTLARVEAEILQRRTALGSKATEYELRGLAQWGARQRANTARLFRLPTPIVGIGLEARDWRLYGPGGRTWDNLVARQAGKGNTGSAAYEALISSATKSNVDVNAKMARGAKFLKTGGGVLAVAGLGLTAYDIYQTPAGQRGAKAERHAVNFAGGLIGAEIGVGLLTIGAGLLLATPPGWIVLGVGLIAGIAGGMIADRIFYPEDYKPMADQLQAGVAVDPRRPRSMSLPSGGGLAPTSLPIIERVRVLVVQGDTPTSLSRRANMLAAASAGLDSDAQVRFADRHTSAGLTWLAGDPSPRTSGTVSSSDLTSTAGKPVIFELSPTQREELKLLGAP